MARRKLEIVLAGDEKGAVRALGATEKAAGGMGKAVLAAGAVVAAAAAGAAVGLFKIGEAFDEQYDKIRVGTGATGDALKSLQGDFKAVVSSVPADFASAGTAVADLNTRLGLTGKPLQDMAGQFLELSRITKTDVATNIQTVTRVFGDFGIAAEDQGPKLDALFRASQSTGIGIDQLSSTMTQFGAPLRQLGFGFDESAALLAKFEKEGVNTEAIMGGMKMSLGKMAKAGEEPIETFARLTGEMAAAGSAGEANAIAVEAFGTRAGPDLAAAVREGRFEVGDLLTTIQSGSETIIQAGKDTQDFGEKWQMIKNRVFVALEPVAMRVFDAIGSAMDTLGPIIGRLAPQVIAFVRDALGSLASWWERNGPMIIGVASAIAAGIKSAFDTVVGAVKLVVRNWDTIKPVLLGTAAVITAVMIPHFVALRVSALIESAKVAGAWVVTQAGAVRAAVVHSGQVVAMVAKWALLGVQSLLHAGKVAAAWLIAMGPIGLVIAAVGGLVALVVRNWDTIKRVTLGLWNSIKGWTASAWSWIRSAFQSALSFIWGLWTFYWNTITGFYRGIWNTMQAVVSGAWRFVSSTISSGLQILGGIWRGAWDGIRGFLSGVWEGIKGTIRGALDRVVAYFRNLPDRILRGLGDLGRLLYDKGKDMVGGLVRGIKDAAKGVGSAVGGAVNSFVSVLNPFGDGPGGPLAPGPRPGGAGRALDRVRSILPAYDGLRITSTYRSPARNRAAGGSPTSFHMDRNNPAVDIGGPTWQLDRIAAALRAAGGWRELLWRTKGHYDHVHVAHEGGVVSSAWPTVPGLAADERPAVLQVGETVVPRGGGMGNWNEVSRQASRMGEDMLQALIGGVEIGARGLPSTFAGVGTDVTTGLASGLRSGEPNVWSAMSMFSQGMPTKVKDQLGIGSPSSVFHGYGHSVGVGYANGIQAAIPQVTAAYTAMMRASGMVQAEDGSWVPRSFFQRVARAAPRAPRRPFAGNSRTSRNRGRPGAIQAEDGSWVMPSFYGRRAHSGGIVSPSWPTLDGLRGDERPAILQLGEQVVPKGKSSGDIHVHIHGNIYGRDMAEREIVAILASAKRKGVTGA